MKTTRVPASPGKKKESMSDTIKRIGSELWISSQAPNATKAGAKAHGNTTGAKKASPGTPRTGTSTTEPVSASVKKAKKNQPGKVAKLVDDQREGRREDSREDSRKARKKGGDGGSR